MAPNPLSPTDLPPTGLPPTRLSPTLTLVFALLWACLLVRETQLGSTEPVLGTLENPLAVADRLASRELALGDAIADSPGWERGLLESAFGTRVQNLESAIEIYSDLGVAFGDAGREAEQSATAKTLEQLRTARDAEAPPPSLEGKRWKRRAELLFAANFALVVLGASALALGGLKPVTLAAETTRSVSWSLGDGLGVWIRAEFYGRLYFHLLWALDNALAGSAFDSPGMAVSSALGLLYGWGTLFSSLPLVWLVYRHLLRHYSLPLRHYALPLRPYTLPLRSDALPRDPLGLDPRALGGLRLLGFSGAAIALDLGGTFVIEALATSGGAEGGWSEGISETLLLGTRVEVALEATDLVLWAPAFEEIAFRGVLYQSLRSRLGPLPSAAISAACFGFLHFYGLAGFAVTFWSGLVWAFVFERARSLWPGFLSHATYNGLYVWSQLAIYR